MATTDAAALEREVIDLSKDVEQDNAQCFDCQSPHPQWASANNAVFLCIRCAGIHRGFGTHISFVRSLSMDTWKQAQVGKMKLGGNKRFREFLQSYQSADGGGYREGMTAHEVYHSWAATQWREKLTKELASETFEPSLPPSTFRPPTPPLQLRSGSPVSSGSIKRPTKGASYSFLGADGFDDPDGDSTVPFADSNSNRRRYPTIIASLLGIVACGGAFFVLFLGRKGD